MGDEPVDSVVHEYAALLETKNEVMATTAGFDTDPPDIKREKFMQMMGGLQRLLPNLINADMMDGIQAAAEIGFRDEKPSDAEWASAKERVLKAKEHVLAYQSQNYVRGLVDPANKDYIFFVMKRRNRVTNGWVKNCVLEKIHINEDEADDKYYEEMVGQGWQPISFDEVQKHLILYTELNVLDRFLLEGMSECTEYRSHSGH